MSDVLADTTTASGFSWGIVARALHRASHLTGVAMQMCLDQGEAADLRAWPGADAWADEDRDEFGINLMVSSTAFKRAHRQNATDMRDHVKTMKGGRASAVTTRNEDKSATFHARFADISGAVFHFASNAAKGSDKGGGTHLRVGIHFDAPHSKIKDLVSSSSTSHIEGIARRALNRALAGMGFTRVQKTVSPHRKAATDDKGGLLAAFDTGWEARFASRPLTPVEQAKLTRTASGNPNQGNRVNINYASLVDIELDILPADDASGEEMAIAINLRRHKTMPMAMASTKAATPDTAEDLGKKCAEIVYGMAEANDKMLSAYAEHQRIGRRKK